MLSRDRALDGRHDLFGAQRNVSTRQYEAAVTDGLYDRDHGGLHGKRDNVRRYWEDQITRYALHRFVEPLVARKRQALSRIRVLDLGAGSGEGYEILTSLKKRGEGLASREIDLLPTEMISLYKGVDLSPAMVAQGRMLYQNAPKVTFDVCDLTADLPCVASEGPFDIYCSFYGSLSHLCDHELRRLVENVCDHFHEGCVFVADLLGRYSFEWPCYWAAPPQEEHPMRQYSMSYMRAAESTAAAPCEHFPMRYWGGAEFNDLVNDVAERKGVRIARRLLWDRSVLVGRHIDTAEFNRFAQPLRRAVNHLHEFNTRTDLESLIFDYCNPLPGFPDLDGFFEAFQVAWNAVVYAAIEALERWKDQEWLSQPAPEAYPGVVQDAITTIRNVVRNIRWFRMGDPCANVVEPQLGYILRNLEMDMQRGLGAGHGLIAIFELCKDHEAQ